MKTPGTAPKIQNLASAANDIIAYVRALTILAFNEGTRWAQHESFVLSTVSSTTIPLSQVGIASLDCFSLSEVVSVPACLIMGSLAGREIPVTPLYYDGHNLVWLPCQITAVSFLTAKAGLLAHSGLSATSGRVSEIWPVGVSFTPSVIYRPGAQQ